jgi:predicted aspartyl protease
LKPSREVTISLVISNKNRQTKLIDAFIDAGYTGFLSLPREIIIALNFPGSKLVCVDAEDPYLVH